jgi:thiamine pyrophosphate-dependent acetolactate synthase large subunit-like protein
MAGTTTQERRIQASSERLTTRGGAWGSDAIVEQLSKLGLRYVALVPGSSYRGVHDSLVNYNDNSEPEILMCLHEEHSVAIAHGYAKVTERPMAAAVHANVGLMHATMAIYNAFCDRVPVVVLGATGPLDAAKRRPWIDWIHTSTDQAALIRPYTKFDDQPHSVQASIDSLVRATALASQIPRAPVYVCLDVSVQEGRLADQAPVRFPTTERHFHQVARPPGASTEDVERVRDRLDASSRPLFLFGRVNRSRQGWENRIRLAERYDARVLTDLKVAAAFPTQHPLHACAPSVFCSPQMSEVIRAADMIVSFDWVDLAGTLQAAYPEGEESPAHIVHISLDSVLHNGWSKDHFGHPAVDHAVSADVDSVVSALLDASPTVKQGSCWKLNAASEQQSNGDHGPVHGTDHKEVKDAGHERVKAPNTFANGVHVSSETKVNGSHVDAETNGNGTQEAAHEEKLAAGVQQRIYMNHLADALYSVVDPDRTCLIRLPLGWKGGDLKATHPLSYLGQDGGAGVGSGPGMAVGAALALKDTEYLPVAVLGDGDFLMGSTALWTAARYRIPLLVVVANNASFFNDEVHQERVARARNRPVENKGVGIQINDPLPDLSQHAASLGVKVLGGQVTDRTELAEVLRQAARQVRQDGAVVVVDVHVYPDGYSTALEAGK